MALITTDITNMPEAEWLALRHPYLGSSDLPTILGEGYSGNTYWQTWKEKSQPFAPPVHDGTIADRLWWGKQFQLIIGEAIVRQFKWTVIEGQHHVADDELRIAATVDFTATRSDVKGPGIIETKNRDWLFFRDRYLDDRAWVYDEIQLAVQMLLHPDATWGAIAVCVGGNELKVFDYRREELEEHMGTIRQAAAAFWDRVARDDEPAITYVDLPLWIADRAALAPEAEPINLPDSAEVDGKEHDIDYFISRYVSLDRMAKESDKLAKDAKARLIQMIGDHSLAIAPEHRIYVNRSTRKERICTEDMVGTVLQKGSTTVTLKVVDLLADKAASKGKPSADLLELARKAQAPLGNEEKVRG